MRRYAAMAIGCVVLGIGFWQASSADQDQEKTPVKAAGAGTDAKAPPERAKDRLRDLQQQRLRLLQQVSEIAEALYKRGSIQYDDVLAAQRELLAVRLEYAETKQDRIKICDQAIELARQMHDIARAHKEGARGTEVEVLKFKDFELQAQIARVEAEAQE